MRRCSTLSWFLTIVGTTVLAAAGPGVPMRNPARKSAAPTPTAEVKRQPTPAPRVASKPPEKKPAPSKPTVTKSEPKRSAPVVSAPARPAAKPAVVSVSAAAASTRRDMPRSTASVEPSTTRRQLRDIDQWVGAVQAQQAQFAGQLMVGRDEVERIQDDASFSALTSDRNRKEAAIPAAAALRASSQRDWSRHLSGGAGRPAPMQVEQLMKQGETIAFRTNTSTSDTQGLVSRIRRTPGVAAGGHYDLDAAAPDLMIAHLRTVPGSPNEGPTRTPYAVQHVDALRARMQRGKSELDEQFSAVRREWIASSTRAEELQRKYMQLRTALVAPDQ